MTARESEFNIKYTGSTVNLSADLTNSLKVAQNSNDYLKFSFSSVSCTANGTDGNLNIGVDATYLTTAKQEAYVNTAVSRALASIITPGMTDSQKEKSNTHVGFKDCIV